MLCSYDTELEDSLHANFCVPLYSSQNGVYNCTIGYFDHGREVPVQRPSVSSPIKPSVSFLLACQCHAFAVLLSYSMYTMLVQYICINVIFYELALHVMIRNVIYDN
jgi:hypothetical protein